MSRIDKTDSAIGIQRGTLAVAWVEADINKMTGVGINSSGLVVKGAGTTGVIGVVIPQTLYDLSAGSRCDILSLGEVVEVGADVTAVGAGKVVFANTTSGALTATSATGLARVGYMIESDRMVVKAAPGLTVA